MTLRHMLFSEALGAFALLPPHWQAPAKWAAGLLLLWWTLRLLVSLVFERFLGSHLSIGRVGWLSVNDIEWSLLQHTKEHTSNRVQAVRVERLGWTLNGRTAKDGDHPGFGWFGLSASGVRVTMAPSPCRGQARGQTRASPSPHDPATSSPSTSSAKGLGTGSPIPPDAPSSANASAILRGDNKKTHRTSTSLIWGLLRTLWNTASLLHDLRRSLRHAIYRALPLPYRRRLAQLSRAFRHRVVAPLLSFFNTLGRYLTLAAAFFALELSDVSIRIPEVGCEVKIDLLRAGMELIRSSNSHIGAWTKIEGVSLLVFYPEGTRTRSTGRSASDPSSPQPTAFSTKPSVAFALLGPLLIDARAAFDASVGLAGLYHRNAEGKIEPRRNILAVTISFPEVALTPILRQPSKLSFEEDRSSLKLRINHLLQLGERLKCVEVRPTLGPHLGPHLHAKPGSEQSLHDLHTASSSLHASRPPPPITPRQNPAAMLQSFKFSLPSLLLESHLDTVPAQDSVLLRTQPSSYTVQARMKGFAAELAIGGTISKSDKHAEWFGRQAGLKATARLGFERFDVEAIAQSASGSRTLRRARLLECSPSGIHLSSSWLPGRLDSLFARPSESAFARSERADNVLFAEDRSINRLVIEGDFGGVHGEAGIEIVDDLLRILPSKHQKTDGAASHESNEDDSDTSVHATQPLQVYDPPVLVVALEVGRCGYRVYGPSGAPHKTAFGPGEDDGGSSPGWLAPSALCIAIPSASVHINTKYMDIIVKRSEAQRKELKRLLSRGKVLVPDILHGALPGKAPADAPSSPSRARPTPLHRESRRRLFDFGDTSASPDQVDLDTTMSPSYSSPSSSPAPDPLLQQPSNLQDSAFIGPKPSGTFNPTVPSAPRPSDEHVRSHPFVYQTEASLLCGKIEVYLMTVVSESGPRDRHTPNGSAGSKDRNGHHTRQHNTEDRQSRSSKPVVLIRHEIAYLGPLFMRSELEVAGIELHQPENFGRDAFLTLLDMDHKQGQVRLQVEKIGVEASRLDVHHALNGLLAVVAECLVARAALQVDKQTEQDKQNQGPLGHKQAKPVVDHLPADIHFAISLAHINIQLAGPDPKFSPSTCRGLALQAQSVIFDYYKQSRLCTGLVSQKNRALLALTQDIRSQANASMIAAPDVPQAYFRFYMKETSLNPLKDADQHSKILRAKTTLDPVGREAAGVAMDWELKNRDKLSDRVPFQDSQTSRSGESALKSHASIKDFFWMPDMTITMTIWAEEQVPGGDEKDISAGMTMVDHYGITVDAPTLIARLEIFQIYCFLLALSALRSLKPQTSIPPAPPLSATHIKRTRPVIQCRADFPEVHLYLTLPHDVRLFARFRRFGISSPDGVDVTVKLDTAIVAGASVAVPGHYDDLIRLRDWSITLKKEPGNSGYHPHAVYVNGLGGRLRLPFKYPFSIIIDNTATFVKAVKQLVHQFVKGQYNSAIEPRAEEPKKIPKIRIALKVLTLEAQDDPFETKLNLIWRAGVDEQADRINRENAFADKVAALAAAEEEEKSLGGATGDPSDGGSRQHRKPALSTEEAYAVLQSVHSTKWIKRHRNAMWTRAKREERQLRRLYAGKVIPERDATLPIQLVSTTGTAPLLRMVLENPVIELSKPTFADSPTGLSDYLADVGKGMPKDMKYSIIIPFHLSWQMSEARVHLRDYPLPLLYIPPVHHTPSEAKSWQLTTDFVIAEELGGSRAIRHVPAVIVPRSVLVGADSIPYVLQVPRTAMPVKTYALPVINITSPWATRIGWGNSIQPAIQDVMRVLDSVTKATPDPSDRMGFWDKLRLILHWRIAINLHGEGPLHFILKGARDPYEVQGAGAGFALCWAGNVRWRMGYPNENREFCQIMSNDFVLGVPDLRDYVDAAATGVLRDQTSHSEVDERSQTSSAAYSEAHMRAYRKDQQFHKVCAKFLGGVKWGLGLKMERTCRDDTCSKCSGPLIYRSCRFFDFKPHYEVHTISSEHPHSPRHDSFAGFRSDFIHFSVSVAADDPGSEANTIHMSPYGFAHFWAWWHLFDGTLSLPIRHGALFPSTQPPSKKFGKHCATIKYRAQLATVFLAHTYKQDSWEDWHEGQTVILGIKARLGSFNVDMHQREQEESVYSEHLGTTRKRLHKAFHRAEIDCKDVDLRVVAGKFADPHKPLINTAFDSEEQEEGAGDRFGLDDAESIAHEELEWVDLDDYRDLYMVLPDENPKLLIVPTFKSPRLTYSRYSQAQAPTTQQQSDDGNGDGSSATAEERVPESKFGFEPSHFCLLNAAADAVDVQLEVAERRVQELEDEISQLTALNHAPDQSDESNESELKQLQQQLHGAKQGVQRFKAYRDRKMAVKESHHLDEAAKQAHYRGILQDKDHVSDFAVYDDLDMWINRLIIHNPNLIISQRIRDILLRYYYSSRQRRLLEYATSARAIKFIQELADELTGKTAQKADDRKHHSRRREPGATMNGKQAKPDTKTNDHSDLLDKFLNDEGTNWSFKEKERRGTATPQSETDSHASRSDFELDPQTEGSSNLPEHWSARNSFIVSLLNPQIAFESDDIQESSTIVVTSSSVQLRVYTIVDELHIDDPINAHVMHRSFGSIDSLQAFYPRLKGWRSGKREHMLFSGKAFVPLEVLSGFAKDPVHMDRIAPRTTARLRYDKHNRLRLLNDGKRSASQGTSSTLRSTLDRLAVECERFSVSATPDQYGAIYDVVTNLLLYTDPGQKARAKRIEQIVLSKDFSNRYQIASHVKQQQDDLRGIRNRQIEHYFRGIEHLTYEEFNEIYWHAANALRRQELLTLWMGAIQTAQDARTSSKSMGMQLDARASEIVWHMREADGTALAKFSVQGVAFRWLNRHDGSVSNCLLISNLSAYNSAPNHTFLEIILKHHEAPQLSDTQLMRSGMFMAVLWSMLTPVGGISIIDRFEVHLHPIKLQLEQTVGKQIMDYIFSQKARKPSSKTESSKPTGSSASSIQSGHSSTSKRMPSSASSSLLSKARSTESLRGALKQDSISSANRSLRDDGSSLMVPFSTSPASSLHSGSGIGARPHSLRRVSSDESLDLVSTKQDDYLPAAEMRARAQSYRTFLHIEIFPTILCLSFKQSDKPEGSKSLRCLPNLKDLIYRSPTIIHCNRIWTYYDLLNHIKKDFRSSLLNQSAVLAGQIIATALRPKHAVQQHVQQRLLGGHAPDGNGSGARRKRSLTSTIRARISSSKSAQDTSAKASPLRSSMVRTTSGEASNDSLTSNDDDDDDNDVDSGRGHNGSSLLSPSSNGSSDPHTQSTDSLPNTSSTSSQPNKA